MEAFPSSETAPTVFSHDARDALPADLDTSGLFERKIQLDGPLFELGNVSKTCSHGLTLLSSVWTACPNGTQSVNQTGVDKLG